MIFHVYAFHICANIEIVDLEWYTCVKLGCAKYALSEKSIIIRSSLPKMMLVVVATVMTLLKINRMRMINDDL